MDRNVEAFGRGRGCAQRAERDLDELWLVATASPGWQVVVLGICLDCWCATA